MTLLDNIGSIIQRCPNVVKYILLAIVLVFIIITVNYLYSQRRKLKNIQGYQESSGIFDSSAMNTLGYINRLSNPSAEESFVAASIIQNNILRDDSRRVQNNAQRHHLLRQAGANYSRMLNNLINNDVNNNVTQYNANFMIHQAEGFNTQVAEELGAMGDTEWQFYWQEFNDLINTASPLVRQETIQQRLDNALQEENKQQAIENYIQSSTIYTSDSQNVHDSSVNKDLRQVLCKLRQDQPLNGEFVEQAFQDAKEYIVKYASKDDDRALRAMTVLKRMQEGDIISTFAERENNIFALTWNRATHPSNTGNSDDIKEAIIDALADAAIESSKILLGDEGTSNVDGGVGFSTVCANGRVGRVLSSLTLLDFDDTVSKGALTFEAYKNQIFAETQSIIEQQINEAKSSQDPELRKIGESYEDPNIRVSADYENSFKERLRLKIQKNIDNYYDKFTPAEIQSIKQECFAAIL